MDVVPGKAEQFQPSESEGKLYGRGTDDMKAAAAVFIVLFKEVAKKLNYPIGLQIVTDEEIGGTNGVRHQIEKGVKTEFFITGESTNLNIKNEAKGVIWLKIITTGKTAHGAYPWRGKNALIKIKTIVDKILKQFPVPNKEVWRTTVNLAKISTPNMTPNKVPDYAEALFDIRYIADDTKNIIEQIEKFVSNQAKIEYLEKEPVHLTAKNNFYIKKLQQLNQSVLNKKITTVKGHGASDARHYSRVGIAGVEFGPVGGGLHSDNEWVDIKSLEDYYQILKTFLLSLK